jgi:hypothetical protein
MLRSMTAVVLGFAFMAATVIVGTTIAGTLFIPGLVIRAFGAVLGGWLTARAAPRAPLAHAAAVATLVLAMSVASAMSAPAGSPQPLWYTALIATIGAGGVLVGGGLRAAAARS